MAEDNELEKRAVEELLRETDRARVRAETMGPAGWLKCPLQGTNKRFLLNTLRSTDLQRRTDVSRNSHSSGRGRVRSESPDRRRERSRSPPTDHRSNGGRAGRTHSPPPRRDGRTSRDKRLDKNEDKQRRHRDDRDKRNDNRRNRDKDRRK